MFQENETILNGKYRIVRLIGEGAMARVWLAVEPDFGGREVALKEPREDLSDSDRAEVERRFHQEKDLAAVLSRNDIPNVVRAFTLETLPDGTRLLVLEYMDGGSLANLIEKHPQGLPLEQALEIAREVLQALAGFHRLPNAPVHRDVKPSNILLTKEGRAKLGDFGLAQLPGASGRTKLVAGPHPGTPLYAAPEQLRSPEPLMPAADLYALGCVLFEMLTGKPYKRVRPGTRASELRAEVPAWLDEALARALAEDPWERWESAEETAKALTPSKSVEALAPIPRPAWNWLASLLLLFMLATVLVLWHPWATAPVPTPTATLTTVAVGFSPAPSPVPSNTSVSTSTPVPTPAPMPSNPTEARVAQVIVSRTDLRSGPGSEYTFLGEISRGTKVEVIARVENARREIWLLVYLPDRNIAWIVAGAVEVVDGLSKVPVAATVPPTPTLIPTSTPKPRQVATSATVPFNHPPEIREFVCSVVAIREGENALFTCNAYDADGDPLTYEWFVDGGRQSTAGPQFIFIGRDVGWHTIRVVVRDGHGGEDFAEQSIRVIESYLRPTPRE